MKKIRRGLKLLILFVILFAVCGATLPSCELAEQLFKETPLAPKAGLTMSFISGKPPAGELSEFDQFQVGLKLINSGKKALEGQLCVFDSPAERFGGVPADECQVVFLESAQQINDKIIPAEERIIFPSIGGTYVYTDLPEDISISTVITADLKWVAQTIVGTDICIRASEEVEVPSEIPCADSETISGKRLEVSPSPVQVTKIEKHIINLGPGTVKLKLDIYIEKVSDGNIIDKDYIHSPGLYGQARPDAEFDIGFVGIPATFTCLGVEGKKVILKEDERVVRCSSIIDVTEYYWDPLIITLDYGFESRVSTSPIKLIKEEFY